MKTVQCHECGHAYSFDPQRVWNSREINSEIGNLPKGMVVVSCPRRNSPRRFLLDPKEQQ